MDLDGIYTRLGEAQYWGLIRFAKEVAGLRAGHVTIDGIKVPYLHRGKGIPVVLLHGFATDKESWLGTVILLSRGVPVIIPDLPGHGEAGALPVERSTPKQYAYFIGKLLDHLGVRQAHLVGNSMGGSFTARFAHDHPSRVRSLTFVSSIGPIVNPSEVVRSIDKGENPLLVWTPEDFTRLIGILTAKKTALPAPVLHYLGVDRCKRRDAFMDLMHGFRNAPAHENVTEETLREIHSPSLVLHGDKDRVIDISSGRALADRLPRSRFKLLKSIGHAPQIECPWTLAREIERHVTEHSS